MSTPNILVLLLDSVRARSTSLHGHSRQTTPFLESLSEHSILYRHGYAPSTTSISSHISLFTGLHEHEHRVYDHTTSLTGIRSIWERLRDDHGYSTGVFTSNPFFRGPHGLRDGFETCVVTSHPYPEAPDPSQFEVDEDAILPNTVQRLLHSLTTDQPLRTLANGVSRYTRTDDSSHYVDSFLEWTESVDGPWGGFINLMDAHTPYLPNPEHNKWADDKLLDLIEKAGGHHDADVERIRNEQSWWRRTAAEHLYEGGIHQADAWVREIVTTLRDQGVFDDTLFIFSADHGEAFGEPSRLFPHHHLICHGVGVHEVQAHVPLLLSPPDQYDSSTIDEPASLTYLPDVVESAVTNQFDPYIFLGDHRAEGPILVSRGFSGDSRYRLDDGFTGEGQVALPDRVYAYYEYDSEGVVKYCKGGERAATVRVHTAQESAKVADDDEMKVDNIFDGIELHDGVQTNADTNLSKGARERLKQFGYLE